MCDECNYKDYINLANEMLDNLDYEFAEETITGIKSWVEEHKHITENQKTALDNIYNYDPMEDEDPYIYH